MLKKTITKEEFIELSKVMDEREIIEQYNIADQNQTNIFQKLKKYSVNSIGFVIGNLGFLKKIVVPVLTLAVVGGGYYGYQKYTEQIGELKSKLQQAETESKNLEYDLDTKNHEIESLEKSVFDLENKSKDLEKQNVQNTADAKANQDYLIDLGNVKSCIMSNISKTSFYNCSVGNKTISCYGFYNHECSYSGQSFSCDISIFKTGIENCK